MKRWNNYRILFFLAGIFFIAQPTYSQKEVDSILKSAKKQIYENPDEAILLANEALDHPELSIETKSTHFS